MSHSTFGAGASTILVLFILLVIVGCACDFGGRVRGVGYGACGY
ncbi:sporulation protein YjcZ [Alteribacter populi]|nr:sporulation protein YjcZ [Alteribacter populi]